MNLPLHLTANLFGPRGLETDVSAVGVQRVASRYDQPLSVVGRELELLRDADGALGRRIRALTTKNAAAIVDRDLTRRVAILDSDGASGTNLRRRSRVPPPGEVELRPPPECLGNRGGRFRVLRGHDAGAETLLKNLEHFSDPSPNRRD